MREAQVHRSEKPHWSESSTLPEDIYAVLRKSNGAVNPVVVVATVDENGSPRTAPFGSLRAVTPELLRLVCWHGHDTYRNLCRNGHISVSVMTPPNIAASIVGRARLIRQHMKADDQHAIFDVTIEKVKNDMVRRVAIESASTISVVAKYADWFQAILGEMEQP